MVGGWLVAGGLHTGAVPVGGEACGGPADAELELVAHNAAKSVLASLNATAFSKLEHAVDQ